MNGFHYGRCRGRQYGPAPTEVNHKNMKTKLMKKLKFLMERPPVRLKYLFPYFLLNSLITRKNPAKSSEAKA